MSVISTRRRHRRKLKNEINVVPYIDVMLVLLIIFMVTAPLLNLGTQVNLPDSEARSLGSPQDPVVVSAYTDRGGYYIIGGVPIGRVDVTAAATDYLGSTTVYNVAQAEGSGTAQTLDFQLVPGETRVPVTGRVVDVTTQEPIVGAEVTVGEFGPVTAGESGAFTVPDVLVGERALVVKADGYDDYRETITVLPGMAALRVQMNSAAPDPPTTPYTIMGTVTLVGAEDNSGAVVEAFDVYNALLAGRTTTDAAGRYWLFVPAGRYTITVSHGDRELSRTIDLPGGGQKLQGIDFTPTVE